MKIILHTGNYKTGSTSLQHHLALNQELLKQHGIYYGDFCEAIHANLSYGILQEALIELGVFDKYQSHPVFDKVACNPEELMSEMLSHANGCDYLVLSHESLFSEMFHTMSGLEAGMNHDLVENTNQFIRRRLLELLEPISNDIDVVCYIRRQDVYAESQYNQYLKAPWYGVKKLPSFEEFLALEPVCFDYVKELDGWSEVFGQERMKVKVYEKEQLPDGILKDFYKTFLHCDDSFFVTLQDVPKNEANLRLGRDVLEVKRKMNMVNAALNQLFCEYALENDAMKDYAYFSSEDRIKFLQQFEETNTQVAKKYLNRSDGRLFYNETFDFPEYPGLQPDRFQEIFGWLAKRLNV